MEWYAKFLPSHSKKLEILHFNDVYNIEERSKKAGVDVEDQIMAGVARFKRAFDLYRSNGKLVIFSGDLFFPSNLSTHFNGEQMVMPFNQLNVDVSCVGNHELDMGIEHGKKLIAETNCPWILTNLIEKNKDRRPLCGVEPFHVLEH